MASRLLRWILAGVVATGLGTAVSAAADPGYRLEPKPASARELKARFSPEELALLEKLNRADISYLHRLSVLVVPEDWGDELSHSPLPSLYGVALTLPKLIVIDQRLQVFGAYEHGSLVLWGPVSTGRRSQPTPNGAFALNWRARSRTSTVDETWFMEWYFNFDNAAGLAMHKYALPGLPASHGCVRLLERDAMWIYEWGERGTPVWIVGAYAFGEPPPWRSVDRPWNTMTLTSALP